MSGFFRETGDGIDLLVRLTPKSSRDAVEGVAAASDGSIHLKARVRAIPENGKANKALERLIAEWLGVPTGTVAVTGGTTARLKTVSVKGDAGLLAARAASCAGGD